MDSVNPGFLIAQLINLAIIAALCGLPLIIGGVLVMRRLRGDQPELKRGSTPLNFDGRGTDVTRAVFLEAGTYRLSYQFTQDAAVKVDLIGLDSGERETLLVKSGAGAQAFSVESGQYLFEVDPAVDGGAWSLQVGPLGLPGRAGFTAG